MLLEVLLCICGVDVIYYIYFNLKKKIDFYILYVIYKDLNIIVIG